jgi:hypothetical protein
MKARRAAPRAFTEVNAPVMDEKIKSPLYSGYVEKILDQRKE